MRIINKSILTDAFAVLGFALFTSNIAKAETNPFTSNTVVHIVDQGDDKAKCGEGKKAKCGEGKCGEGKKAKCGEGKKAKCGEGKKAKCGEGKCGEGKKAPAKKCGE